MGAAEKLFEGDPATPPFDIMRSAYVELRVSDLEASVHFYSDLLGLAITDRTDDAVYLRGWEEQLHHSLVLRAGPVAGTERLSFRVRREEDLDAIQADFESRGCVTRWVDGDHPGMGRALRVWDAFGFPLEFFYEMSRLKGQLRRYDLHRGAPIMRLDHFNLHSPYVEEGMRQWMSLGFRCTEYVSTDGDEDEKVTGAWLMRKPTVHDVAFTAGRGPRLHHTGLATADALGVLRACDQLAAAGAAHAIERGPGRHGISNAFFVYLRDPDGHRIELYTGDYYTGDPDLPPYRWSVADPTCRSFYGTPAPDSWYDESSVVLDPNGAPAETVEADVDERDVRSDLLA